MCTTRRIIQSEISPDLSPSASANTVPALTRWMAWRDSARYLALAVVIMFLAAALRAVGLFDDFWLDEIWTWSYALRSKSIGHIFFGIHHDNNHYLNTLWIYTCGNQPHWFVYRLHSYLSGLVTILGGGLLAGDIASDCYPQSKIGCDSAELKTCAAGPSTAMAASVAFAQTASLATMLLLATSYVACVYSTEARGYAVAGAAAVLSTASIRRIVFASLCGQSRYALSSAYALLSIVGVTSHLSFVTVFVPHLIWSTFQLMRCKRYLTIMICHLPTIFVFFILWYFDLRHAVVGGGSPTSLLDVGLESLALPAGAFGPKWLVAMSALIVLIGVLDGLKLLLRVNLADAWLFGLLLLLSPPLVLGLRAPELLSIRHFLVVWMTLFPLLGLAVADVASWSKGRWLVLVVVTAFWVYTNGVELCQFARYGRGGYSRTIDWLVAETRQNIAVTGRRMWIGSDHDFRNRMVLYFYQNRIPSKIPLGYLRQEEWPPEGVDWYLVHQFDRDAVPAAEIQVGNRKYDLAHVERYSAPMGWNWFVYRRRVN